MKLWHSFLKELKLGSKSFYFYMELLMAVIIIVILTMVVPENFESKADEYIFLDLDSNFEEMFIDSIYASSDNVTLEETILEIGKDEFNVDLYETDEKRIYIFDSEVDMKKTAEKKKSLGVTIKLQDNGMFFDYYLQGYESEKFINIVKSVHVLDAVTMQAEYDKIPVKSLGGTQDVLTDRENLLPLFLYFNGSLMGLFIIAAYIFLDKGEGVIRAYAITASKVSTYLLSKVLLLSVTSLVTSFAVTFAVMGFDFNFLGLFILVLTSGFFVSIIGLILSSYYSNIMQSFGVLYILIILLSLPAIAYNIPAWNPAWIQAIPTHYMIIGFKEIIIENGDFMYVALTSLIFLLMSIALMPVATYRFKKTLTVGG